MKKRRQQRLTTISALIVALSPLVLVSSQAVSQQNTERSSHPSIHQETSGERSPAVAETGGNVIINTGGEEQDRKKQTKEEQGKARKDEEKTDKR